MTVNDDVEVTWNEEAVSCFTSIKQGPYRWAEEKQEEHSRKINSPSRESSFDPLE
jgi:hypothetical protein